MKKIDYSVIPVGYGAVDSQVGRMEGVSRGVKSLDFSFPPVFPASFNSQKC
jgi:hypothetical protein